MGSSSTERNAPLKADAADKRFSWEFWTSLHNNYGSAMGYGMAFLLILLMNHTWMLEEMGDISEGHSVSKTFVILFVIYSYSFVTLGLELVQCGILCSVIYFPYPCFALITRINGMVQGFPIVKKIMSAKYLYTVLATLYCMLHAMIGSILWTWFWYNHTCKSYHDRQCRKSPLGKLVIAYRDNACYDGKASSAICEKFVSYLPIMVLSVIVVFLGNVLLPFINDQLSLVYPPRLEANLEALLNRIDRLEKEKDANVKKGSGSGFVYEKLSLATKNFNFSRMGPNNLGSNNDEDECDNALSVEDDLQFTGTTGTNRSEVGNNAINEDKGRSDSGSRRQSLFLLLFTVVLLLLDLMLVLSLSKLRYVVKMEDWTTTDAGFLS